MEYLPDDPNETEPINVEKREKKLKGFREYLVDKGVILSFVKVLLSLKYSENKPKNPIKSIREFFGKYHDKRWDEIEVLKEEIIILNQENPKLLEKIIELEEELETGKFNKRLRLLFQSYEMDKNGHVDTKQIIEKLNGNKKFEVDEKLGIPEFTKLIKNICDNNIENEKVLVAKMEESIKGYTANKDDQQVLKMIQILKEMKKSSGKK